MSAAENTPPQRRRFFGQLLGGIAAAAGLPSVASAADDMEAIDSRQHDAWMRQIGGQHRQIFHAAAHSELPMIMAMNFMDVYGSEFGARPGQARAVIGVHGSALPIGLQSALWDKYELGKASSITDPETREPAKRNIFWNDTPTGINRLMERGVTLLVCNMALKRQARLSAAARSMPDRKSTRLNSSHESTSRMPSSA